MSKRDIYSNVSSAYKVPKTFESPHEILEEIKYPFTTWTDHEKPYGAPVRPVLPSNYLSPVPPPRPPTPLEFRNLSNQTSRPDNFARPYGSSSFRGIF